MQVETRGSSLVAVGNTGLLLMCRRGLKAPMELQQELSVPLWDSGSHSSHSGKLKVPLESLHVNLASSRVEAGNLGLF